MDINKLMYEDELPKNMSREDYDKWFAQSEVINGVRMGVKYPFENKEIMERRLHSLRVLNDEFKSAMKYEHLTDFQIKLVLNAMEKHASNQVLNNVKEFSWKFLQHAGVKCDCAGCKKDFDQQFKEYIISK